MSWRRIGIRLLVVCSYSAAYPSMAQRALDRRAVGESNSVSISAGVVATDNIAKDNKDNARSRTEAELGFSANVGIERERLSSSLEADLQYRSVKYNGKDHQLAGGLHAQTEITLLSERLSWSVEDDLAQSLVNSLDVSSPGNTQNTNIFSTGPRLVLPLGSRSSFALDGKWTNIWYQSSDFGNNRITGRATLLRKSNSSSQLSLNAQVQKVKYKELTESEDYDIKSAYIGWLAEGVRTTLQLDAGLTRVSEETGSASGALASMSITRLLNARSQLKLNAGRNFGSAADNLRLDQELRGVSAGSRPGAISSDPMRSDYATAAWIFNGPRSSATLRGDWRHENHRTETVLNRLESRGEVQISRVLGPRLSLEFLTGYSRNKYNQADVRFSEWDVSVGVSWRFRDAFSIGLRASHTLGEGDSSDGPNTRDFTENRGELRLVYTPRF